MALVERGYKYLCEIFTSMLFSESIQREENYERKKNFVAMILSIDDCAIGERYTRYCRFKGERTVKKITPQSYESYSGASAKL